MNICIFFLSLTPSTHHPDTYLFHICVVLETSLHTAAAAAKSLQSCPTLCDPIDSSPPGSPVPGILQARTLKWVAISFSNAWKWKGKVKSLSRVWLLATPWTAAYQALPSMGFSRQEYWSWVPLPSPGWEGQSGLNPQACPSLYFHHYLGQLIPFYCLCTIDTWSTPKFLSPE